MISVSDSRGAITNVTEIISVNAPSNNFMDQVDSIISLKDLSDQMNKEE
jgi:hypothetical protein